MKTRDIRFDYMKGWLIILVILGHSVLKFEDSFVSKVLFEAIYSFHMPLFVFLSGYFFFNKKKSNSKELIFKQTKRLLLPVLSWLVVTTGFLLIFNIDILTEKCNIKGIYHYVTSAWFLYCIFFCSILANVLYRMNSKFLWIGIFLFLFLGYFFFPLDVFFKHQQVAFQFPFFIAGIAYRSYRQERKNTKQNLFILAVAAVAWTVLLYVYIFYKGVFSDYIDFFYKMIFGGIGVFLFFNVFSYIPKINFLSRGVAELGVASLGIYLIHGRIYLYVFPNYFDIVASITDVYAIQLLISSVVLLAISYSLTQLIRLNKYTKLLFLGEKQ